MSDNTPAIVPEYLPQSAVESVSRAEIDVSISTAQRYPHHSAANLSKVKTDMISFATLDQETAESCFYTLPRGGKNIQGPSVRLAEIAVACYGNLRAGSRILSVVAEGDNPHVVVQAVAHDLEKNIHISIEKRRRIVKKKMKDRIDEDDINLAANACSAICFRDAVFKVIPLALIKPVFEAAKKVAIGDQKTLADRRARCMATFQAMGVVPAKVLAKLGKRAIDDIDLNDLETLIGLHNAIKEGEVNIDEAFATEASVAAAHAPEPTPMQKAQQAAAAPAADPQPMSAAQQAAAAPAADPQPMSAAQQAAAVEAKRRGRPPGSKNKVEKLTPQEAAAERKKGMEVAPSAIAYPEGTGPEDYDVDGNPLPKQAYPAAPAPEPQQADDTDLAAMGLAPEPEKAPEAPTPAPGPEPAAAPAEEPMEFKARAGEESADANKRALGYLGMLMEYGNVTPNQLLAFCKKNNLSREGQKLTDLATDKLFNLGKNWAVLLPKIAAFPA
jgi:hypothetical protein